MTTSQPVWRRASTLSIGGALAFWVANFAISLTPMAAEYRAALSIPYLPMLGASLIGGLVVGLGVAYPLVRVGGGRRRPPIVTSLGLSVVALAIVTVVIEGPATVLTTMTDPLRYFLFDALFNTLRILALGAVIGALYARSPAAAPLRTGWTKPPPSGTGVRPS